MTTTADTITDDQIQQLWTEAANAGDSIQQAICRLALDSDDRARLIRTLGSFGPEEWQDITAWARSECARVIADAQAMAD